MDHLVFFYIFFQYWNTLPQVIEKSLFLFILEFPLKHTCSKPTQGGDAHGPLRPGLVPQARPGRRDGRRRGGSLLRRQGHHAAAAAATPGTYNKCFKMYLPAA